MPSVELKDLKDELNLTSDEHDYELVDKLIAAEAEYAERVRLLPGTYTETTTLPAILPRGTVSATATLAGSPTTTVLASSGLLTGLAYGQVVVTYTVGPIPPHHRAAIVADVAEWFTRTQRGGGQSRPSFGGDAGLEPDTPSRPVVMWPRIRALSPGLGIA